MQTYFVKNMEYGNLDWNHLSEIMLVVCNEYNRIHAMCG